MGYTADVFLLTIEIAPLVLTGAAVLLLPALWIGLVPRGPSAAIGGLLIFCGAYGGLYLFITLDMLILTPARLQERYLGQAVAGPLSLTSFEQTGFQDPASEWRYRLSAQKAETLRRRCRWSSSPAGGRQCSLYGAMDERWFADVSLEGNELRMIDGLH